MISSQENLSALTTAESRTPRANKIHKDLRSACRVPLMTAMLSYWYFIYDVKSVVIVH